MKSSRVANLVVQIALLSAGTVAFAAVPYQPKDSEMKHNLEYLDDNKQDESYRLFTSTPTYNEIGDKTIQLLQSGGQTSLFIRIGTDTYKVILQKL